MIRHSSIRALVSINVVALYSTWGPVSARMGDRSSRFETRLQHLGIYLAIEANSTWPSPPRVGAVCWAIETETKTQNCEL